LKRVKFLFPKVFEKYYDKPKRGLSMEKRLKGKVAIVTGAGSVVGPTDREPVGNGKASAMLYARNGAAVLAVGRDIKAVEDTCKRIEDEGGACVPCKADVSKAEDCKTMAETCIERFGAIDILHNNVGIVSRNPGGILEVDEEDWDTVMDINIKSMFHTCRAVIPFMLSKSGGSIINISSVGSLLYKFPKLFIYTISKAAVNSFTKCLAYEMAEKGIRVNCIMPGMIDTPVIYKEILKMYDNIEQMRQDRNSLIPMKHMGEPWDIAHAALFLASDEAKYITGQILAVDGGILLTGA